MTVWVYLCNVYRERGSEREEGDVGLSVANEWLSAHRKYRACDLFVHIKLAFCLFKKSPLWTYSRLKEK